MVKKRNLYSRIRERILTEKHISKFYYFLVWLISDAYLISYGRSGRTWTKVVLGKILSEVYHIKKKDYPNYFGNPC